MRVRKKASSRRRRGFKVKLRKNTIYTLFGLGFIFISALLMLSYTRSGESLILLNDMLDSRFGWTSFFMPFALLFFGFFFLHLKMYLSRANVAIGFFLFFISLLGLTKSGTVGQSIFQILEEILTTAGADLVFIAGLIVGNIVFFDTSIDELIQAIAVIGRNMYRLFPTKLFWSKKRDGEASAMLDRNKPITIKGGQKELTTALAHNRDQHGLIVNKKDPVLLSDKLVSNALSGRGIWEYPPLSLLSEAPGQKADRGDINKIASVIEKTLQSFGVEARVAEVNLGPAVTQYALEIALGTKVSKITSLANDLALATEAPTGQIRIEAPIPGRNLVGIEIPNRSLEIVTLKTMLASEVMQKSKSKLTVSLGLDVSGSPVVVNIAKMPHVLVAGTTGSGKSVLINAFICSLLFRVSPAEVKLILIDPKRVEFTSFNGIPHLLTPVIVESEKILSALKWAMGEMDRRYKLFAERGVRNIEGYNELSGFQALPYIVIIVDELADLMMFAPVEVEDAIARIAQMARATGIHLVIATQRPSVNVITGLIKANIPCRIAFNVSSMIDSRVIIDGPGAEKLLGRGDMLYIPPEQAKPTRIQGAFVSEKEVKKLVEFLKAKNIPIEYTEEIVNQPLILKKAGTGPAVGGDGRDPLFEDVVRLVCQFDTASASFLQRKMSIGYSRAARILDQLEESGIVGHAEGSKPREVIVRNADEFLTNLQQSQN
ncbi:MAG: DNA translocase FtsK [Candidatus Levybacteria bacterium]|nr:DNA translocase FtsK [Candidatus Levybacteria bacterium]